MLWCQRLGGKTKAIKRSKAQKIDLLWTSDIFRTGAGRCPLSAEPDRARQGCCVCLTHFYTAMKA